jgi:hypothetical protein
MAPAGKYVNWLCETPEDAEWMTQQLVAVVNRTGGYAIDQTPAGLVLTRKYFPTWRVLLFGLPAVIFGRKAETANVRIEPASATTARVSVTGRLASWMRNDLRHALEALGATPPDFAKRTPPEPTAELP